MGVNTSSAPRTVGYFRVYAALMALLALTVAAAFVPWHRLFPSVKVGLFVAMFIAGVKGVLILLYFMHVRYATPPIRVFAAAGFLWLGILFVLTFSDYMTRNHPAGVNPNGEPRYLKDGRPDVTPPTPGNHLFEHASLGS